MSERKEGLNHLRKIAKKLRPVTPQTTPIIPEQSCGDQVEPKDEERQIEQGETTEALKQ